MLTVNMGSWSTGAPLLDDIPERDETLGSEGESLLSSPRSEPVDLDADLTDSLLDRDSVLDDENASSISIQDTESSIHDSEDSVLGSPSFNRDFTNVDNFSSPISNTNSGPCIGLEYAECHYDFTKTPPPDIALPTSVPPSLNAILGKHQSKNSELTHRTGGLPSELSRFGLNSTNLDAANLNEPLQLQVPSPLDAVLDMTKQAGLIAQSIGQAFQVAYMEFLKANGIEDTGLMKEMDYQEVLNQQEIFGEELYMFSNKEMQKEVIVPKLKGEPLGVVIVESGWGSMVPTVVLANMSPSGAAARCGQLNIGDQIMSINGISLVGLPLSACQNYVKAAKNQTVVKLTVVSCAPVVEVLIKRPDVKYQLGFSVQNGVICSLLRGGIAERGGVRVGHRIIEINGQSVVAVPHEKIVNMLATSVGEIHMKTMPTSIYRLLTGQETPSYM